MATPGAMAIAPRAAPARRSRWGTRRRGVPDARDLLLCLLRSNRCIESLSCSCFSFLLDMLWAACSVRPLYYSQALALICSLYFLFSLMQVIPDIEASICQFTGYGIHFYFINAVFEYRWRKNNSLMGCLMRGLVFSPLPFVQFVIDMSISSFRWVNKIMSANYHQFFDEIGKISAISALWIPVAPLHQAADTPVFSPSRMDDSCGSFLPPEKGIPTMITWNSGGNEVAVEGSWDNWTSRRILQRSGNDYSLLLVLPSGIYQYKFIVDGEWRHIPDLPHIADERGQVVNLLDVHDYVPENVDGVADFEAPPSPDSSYGQPFPVDEDFAKEPPLVPPQLHLTVLGAHSEEASTKPEHVVLNHLFIEKGWASQSLVALGLTHRFQSKYVTVVLYKPLTR